MSHLQIFLLGSVRVFQAGQSSPVKITRICQALLAYLLLHRYHSHSRELLAGLFWGDYKQEQARRSLNTTLWRLRRVLKSEDIPLDDYLLTTGTGEVKFNADSDYWLDAAVFETQTSQFLAKPIQEMEAGDVQNLEHCLKLYSGELLEGFYDDWALRERERLRLMYLNSLAHLMNYYKHHRAFEQSLACGQRILDQDPLREEIHREMMRLYLENGQRALAVKQYQRCCEILTAELGIPPMAETQLLQAQITASSSLPALPAPPISPVAGNGQALLRLERAIQKFDEAREQLEEAIQLVKHPPVESNSTSSSTE